MEEDYGSPPCIPDRHPGRLKGRSTETPNASTLVRGRQNLDFVAGEPKDQEKKQAAQNDTQTERVPPYLKSSSSSNRYNFNSSTIRRPVGGRVKVSDPSPTNGSPRRVTASPNIIGNSSGKTMLEGKKHGRGSRAGFYGDVYSDDDDYNPYDDCSFGRISHTPLSRKKQKRQKELVDNCVSPPLPFKPGGITSSSEDEGEVEEEEEEEDDNVPDTVLRHPRHSVFASSLSGMGHTHKVKQSSTPERRGIVVGVSMEEFDVFGPDPHYDGDNDDHGVSSIMAQKSLGPHETKREFTRLNLGRGRLLKDFARAAEKATEKKRADDSQPEQQQQSPDPFASFSGFGVGSSTGLASVASSEAAIPRSMADMTMVEAFTYGMPSPGYRPGSPIKAAGRAKLVDVAPSPLRAVHKSADPHQPRSTQEFDFGLGKYDNDDHDIKDSDDEEEIGYGKNVASPALPSGITRSRNPASYVPSLFKQKNTKVNVHIPSGYQPTDSDKARPNGPFFDPSLPVSSSFGNVQRPAIVDSGSNTTTEASLRPLPLNLPSRVVPEPPTVLPVSPPPEPQAPEPETQPSWPLVDINPSLVVSTPPRPNLRLQRRAEQQLRRLRLHQRARRRNQIKQKLLNCSAGSGHETKWKMDAAMMEAYNALRGPHGMLAPPLFGWVMKCGGVPGKQHEAVQRLASEFFEAAINDYADASDDEPDRVYEIPRPLYDHICVDCGYLDAIQALVDDVEMELASPQAVSDLSSRLDLAGIEDDIPANVTQAQWDAFMAFAADLDTVEPVTPNPAHGGRPRVISPCTFGLFAEGASRWNPDCDVPPTSESVLPTQARMRPETPVSEDPPTRVREHDPFPKLTMQVDATTGRMISPAYSVPTVASPPLLTPPGVDLRVPLRNWSLGAMERMDPETALRFQLIQYAEPGDPPVPSVVPSVTPMDAFTPTELTDALIDPEARPVAGIVATSAGIVLDQRRQTAARWAEEGEKLYRGNEHRKNYAEQLRQVLTRVQVCADAVVTVREREERQREEAVLKELQELETASIDTDSSEAADEAARLAAHDQRLADEELQRAGEDTEAADEERGRARRRHREEVLRSVSRSLRMAKYEMARSSELVRQAQAAAQRVNAEVMALMQDIDQQCARIGVKTPEEVEEVVKQMFGQ